MRDGFEDLCGLPFQIRVRLPIVIKVSSSDGDKSKSRFGRFI